MADYFKQIDNQYASTSTTPCIVDMQVSEGEMIFENKDYSSLTNRTKELIKKDSTETKDLNRLTEHYLHMFEKNEANFLFAVSHSDFEDGMDNEAIEMMRKYVALSQYPAIIWFSKLFNTHIGESDISYRLLRIISLPEYKDYSSILISLVRGALNDKNLDVQEAAFLALENWRTEDCLKVLRSTGFVNPLLENYINTLKAELEKELC